MPGKVYRGIGPERGICVKADIAFSYALNRCLYGPDKEEFRDMLVEWFYSGNWIKEEED
ncbi:hypothetical protein [Hungatella hathewayi]